MIIGEVEQIWRYPVKSLGGESLTDVRAGLGGIAGDRHWAVYDPLAPTIRSAKQWPELLELSARYAGSSEPGTEDRGAGVQPVRLLAPDGSECGSEAQDCADWLQQRLGRVAELRRRQPAAEHRFYALPGARSAGDIAAELGLAEGEALPDFSIDNSDLAAQLAACATPPGFLYDAYPMHILTRDSLQALHRRTGLNTDVRRFRPNLLLGMRQPADQFTEQGWLGKVLEIGEVLVRIHSPTLRCSMPGRAQPGFGLAAEPGLPRCIARHAERNLGVNTQILRVGRIRVGDTVRIHSS